MSLPFLPTDRILTVLPCGQQPVGMLARQPGDRGIEAAAQAALGGAHDEEMRLVLAGAGEERRRVVAAFHRG